MPLVYLPDQRRLFLWGDDLAAEDLRAVAYDEPTSAELIVPPGELQRVEGRSLGLLGAVTVLAGGAAREAEAASVQAWRWAAKLALELVTRECIAPSIAAANYAAPKSTKSKRVAPKVAERKARKRSAADHGSGGDEQRGNGLVARWHVSLLRAEDIERVAQLARALPPAAHAVPAELLALLEGRSEPQLDPPKKRSAARKVKGDSRATKAASTTPAPPHALLVHFLDAVADALVRAAQAAKGWTPRAQPRLVSAARRRTWLEMGDGELERAFLQDLKALRRAKAGAVERWAAEQQRLDVRQHVPWEDRWLDALQGPEPVFATEGFAERGLGEELARWAEPAVGDSHGPLVALRLELPEGQDDLMRLRFLLQSREDPSLLVEAADLWSGAAHLEGGEESLLRGLGRAARLFAPIRRALEETRPCEVALSTLEAHAFLVEAAPALAESGLLVQVPADLATGNRQPLRLRLRLGASTGQRKRRASPRSSAAPGIDLATAVSFEWRVALGDDELTAAELRELARRKAGLLNVRGRWISVDPAELEAAARRLQDGRGELEGTLALRSALLGEEARELPVEVVPEGEFAKAIERLRDAARAPATPPAGLVATLRPYQLRGVAWLSTLDALGLGACLADDMGLGKTLQAIGFLLARRERVEGDRRPVLVVAPTSVVGNWERELARFAPKLCVLRHHGASRARKADELAAEEGAVYITSYGTLRLDAELLAAVDWSAVVLDEAQNVKNPASATAQAARALRGGARLAMTGTPLENHLSELWSILQFANPGLLGSLEEFRRRFAVPIERFGDENAAANLRSLVQPFVLRRLKRDPTVAADLPEKAELDVACGLTREQASLYQAQCERELAIIEDSDGMQRRGRVLALLTALKQICNHPAQFLKERRPLAGRSGKLERLVEMLEEVCLSGEKALVFTQYRAMGELLVAHLADRLGPELARGAPLFLHGGVPRARRDEFVDRFQDEERGPRLFVLSLKAGGTGLNLTAAQHVFHFDRWWNPAVEDQATDRAHRIGQRRRVEVHRFLCAGTIEERVAEMLAKKRALAEQVVGAGERWLTELRDDELRELVALSGESVNEEDEASTSAAPPPDTKKRMRAAPRRKR